MKRIEKMQENEHRLDGKTIIGIDPAKSKRTDAKDAALMVGYPTLLTRRRSEHTLIR